MEGRLLFQVAVKDVMLPGGDEPLQRPGTLHHIPSSLGAQVGLRITFGYFCAGWNKITHPSQMETVLKAQANTKSIVKTGLWRHCKPWLLQ